MHILLSLSLSRGRIRGRELSSISTPKRSRKAFEVHKTHTHTYIVSLCACLADIQTKYQGESKQKEPLPGTLHCISVRACLLPLCTVGGIVK